MSEEDKKAKQKIIEIWDKVAPKFGKIGPNYWDCLGDKLVHLSNINKGAVVLDIGTGRGASLFPAANRVGKNGRVIGIDISEVMVKETNKDIAEKNLCNAEVIKMDGEALDFSDNYFDNIIGGFSIGFLLHTEAKLKEVLRTLKRGGEVAFSTWGVQEDQKWLAEIFKRYLPDNTPDYVMNKKSDELRFNTEESVRKVIEDSGFRNIRVFEENKEVVYKDKEEWWKEMWSNSARGIFEQIEETGDDKLKELKREIFKEIEAFRKEEGFSFNMPVIYVLGEK